MNSLINNYNKNKEILMVNHIENCSIIYYCYSSNNDIDTLININSKLTYINLKECKNSLINNNVIEENSDLLIVGKQNLENSDSFEYKLYENNGNKINNLSVCHNNKIETISSIDNLKIYENAISLFEQGYDIFNLSSSFYYDICLAVHLDNSDITLNIRQNDIKPKENSICLDGCIYNGVNLTTKRISCLCDIDLNKQNESEKNNTKEEIKENFFSYILNMINYKIIKCYKLFNNKINFYQNYGFYIGTTIYIIIFTLFIIYIIYGSKIIKIKYLRYEPKNEENQIGININNNIINNEINMVDSDVNIINKNKKTSSLFHNRDNNYNHKIKCKKC